MDRTKVILDTDIGTDIDDAVALAYLLEHPGCELLGITTVTGEAVKRASLASALCRRAGKDVPIYPGAERPLLTEQRQRHAQQAAALAPWPHEKNFPSGEAVEFMRATIRRHPGEVVLLTVAPLTNIGLLFSVDPAIPRLLKGLVMMCGRFFDPPPTGYGPVEWNAMVDAHATRIVYEAPVPVHRSIGLDVTHRVSMRPPEFRQAFAGFRLFDPILEWAEIWFRDRPGTTFHDPLAAAVVFEPNLCSFRRGNVRVALQPEERYGSTDWTPDETGGAHEVAADVNPASFFEQYLSVIGKGGR